MQGFIGNQIMNKGRSKGKESTLRFLGGKHSRQRRKNYKGPEPGV